MSKFGHTAVGIFVLVLNVGFSLGSNRLYSGLNCAGLFLELPDREDHPSLSDFKFDNVTKSVKLDGTWLLYDLKRYNEENITAAYEFVSTRSDTCYNLITTSGIVSSLRAIGYDYNEGWESLDLFTMGTYAGPKEPTILDYAFTMKYVEYVSAVLMGETSWTLYSEEWQEGLGYCLFPDEGSSETWINDFQELDPPIPYAFIKSVQQGCQGVDAIHVRRSTK